MSNQETPKKAPVKKPPQPPEERIPLEEGYEVPKPPPSAPKPEPKPKTD